MADTPITIREALSAALREEMRRDERVFIMGEEVGVWGGTYAVTRGFLDEFGAKRVRDTPISEMVIAGAATGAAMYGLRPIAEIMTINFAFLALDAIINHAAKVRYMFNGQFTVPLVIRTTTGGGKQLGATHSHAPEVIFAHFPGLYVGIPSTAYDAKGMLKAAIRDDNPVMFVEHSTMLQRRSEVPDDDDFVLPIGKSDVKREGDDVTIVTFGKGVEWSIKAAEMLEKDGIQAEIVDLRWLRPLDLEPVYESFKKTNRCVIVEESLPMFNVGAEVAAKLQENMFDYMDAPIKRVAAMDQPLPYSRDLELMALPSAEKVVAAVKELV
ncbi:MAG TPA: alpha-ketoacid dehydrogenase subunit beta [Aggregatilinea sp.]|uniref:alpha-ketoacid dehydrogenase subunit beta n=1 Tax=Aggregatilinea sp. TaxID=2806333 RepID=UPI002C783CE0|nr:alpha-ketoacid dehydrogenase subunit beta [Aggregatilinea sp.]HML23291.1 alpha-ketoacid dehydrogenase subunit beta [Aggregatilinea sp.]